MSQGIPCCKQFSILIDCPPIDCTGLAQTPDALSWAVYAGPNTGNGTWAASAAGASGTFSLTGSSAGGFGSPGSSSDGYISCQVCNNGPAKTFRFTFSVTYDVQAPATQGDSQVDICPGTVSDDLPPFFQIFVANGSPAQSASEVITYDVPIPACTSPTTINFRFDGGAQAYTVGPDSYSMNGTFTVAIL